ncbi:MAG: PAS-domain containing protein, partial [Hyphomicrobium sp.]|nr:PAS-domain containing protein [Hyphomicrobium sp.]
MEKGLLADLSTQFTLGALPPGVLTAAAVLVVLSVAAITFLVARFGGGDALGRAHDEQLRAEQLRQESQRFAIALNNVSQGIVMFDAAERVVVWNERYLELSGLSADFMRVGRTFTEILHERKTLGTFQPDIDAYRRELLEDIARGNAKSVVLDGSDGRSCHVIIVPMAAGGWITTHEDITEQVAAKRI